MIFLKFAISPAVHLRKVFLIFRDFCPHVLKPQYCTISKVIMLIKVTQMNQSAITVLQNSKHRLSLIKME